MTVIGLENRSTQTVATDGALNLGSIYHGAGKCISQSPYTFRRGLYHVTVVATFTAPAAGNVTLTADGHSATTTITTADTEVRTLVLDFYTLIPGCTFSPVTVTNTGVGATFTSVITNIEKVA